MKIPDSTKDLYTLPSAFSIPDVLFLSECYRSGTLLIKISQILIRALESENSFAELLKSVYPLQVIKSLFRSTIFSLIAVSCIPLTILADIIVGIFESSIGLYKGLNLLDAATILKKKSFYAPIQQIAFLAIYSTLPVLFASAVIIIRKIFQENVLNRPLSVKSYLYTAAISFQVANTLISTLCYLKARLFIKVFQEIFFLDQWDIFFSGETIQPANNHDWGQKLSNDEFNKISHDLDPSKSDSYNEFKTGVLAKKLPHQLLGLTEKHPTVNTVETAYRKIAIYLHPDKNKSSDEATILFKCLNMAKEALIATNNQSS